MPHDQRRTAEIIPFPKRDAQFRRAATSGHQDAAATQVEYEVGPAFGGAWYHQDAIASSDPTHR